MIPGRKSGRSKTIPLEEDTPDVDVSVGPGGEIRIRVVP